MVDQADDAAGEAGAVVGLDAGRVEGGEAPAGGDQLLVGGGIAAGRECGQGGEGVLFLGGDGVVGGICVEDLLQRGIALDEQGLGGGVDAFEIGGRGLRRGGEFAAAEHHEEGDGVGGVGGDDDGHLDVDVDGGAGGVVDVADEFGREDGGEADAFLIGLHHRPGDLGGVRGDTAVDLAAEVFEDLGAALVPPHGRGGDGLAVAQAQRVGEIGVGVCLGLLVVGVVGAFSSPLGPSRRVLMPSWRIMFW